MMAIKNVVSPFAMSSIPWFFRNHSVIIKNNAYSLDVGHRDQYGNYSGLIGHIQRNVSLNINHDLLSSENDM